MSVLADLLQRVHLPFLAAALGVGLGIAAGSRDLGKRLLGAGVAGLAGVVEVALLSRDDPSAAAGALAACLVVLGASALALALLVRVREGFGGVDAGGLQRAELVDDRAERGE